jgi:transposase, IS5 family
MVIPPINKGSRSKQRGIKLKLRIKESFQLRQTYRRTLKNLILAQRFRNHPKIYRKARKAARKLKTIAERLTRELKRKLPIAVFQQYSSLLEIFNKVLDQQRNSSKKI